MKTKTIGSLFVLFAIASMAAAVPSAYADHAKVVVENAAGSSTPGCEPDCFIPATATIDAGGEVVFTNNDTAAHTSTAGTPTDGPSGVWDSSLVMVGMSYSVILEEPGEYPYFCMVHPWMTGLVIVEAAGAAEEEHDDDHGEMEMASTPSVVDIQIGAPETASADERITIDVTILDGMGMGTEHTNYDVVVTHDGETLYEDSVHSHTGESSHDVTLSADASDDNPVDVSVTFTGFGMAGDEMTGPIGTTNNVQVVPEFGTIAALILVVAIASIIAITAKSKVSLMPKL
jgi:predicted secreted protein with PEFG-CTERM motif